MEEQNNTEMNSQPQVQETENVQTTIPDETKPPKKKRNWLFTLFACIMTAIIVALAMNIGQQLSKGINNNPPKSNTTDEKKDEGNNTTELTNELKATIMYKMAALIGDSDFKYKGVEKGLLYPHCNNCGTIFNKIMSNETLTEEEKSVHIMGYAKGDGKDSIDLTTIKTDNQSIINSYKHNAEVSNEKDWNNVEASIVSISEYDEIYSSIYGTKPSKYTSVDGCPTVYLYDKGNNRFLIMPTYGGCSISLVSNQVYMDGIEATDDKTIVVYAYVGHSRSNYDGNAEFYNSYETDKTAKKIKEYETINEQNKNDFKKFKFTFEKNSDNNYVYKNVEEA